MNETYHWGGRNEIRLTVTERSPYSAVRWFKLRCIPTDLGQWRYEAEKEYYDKSSARILSACGFAENRRLGRMAVERKLAAFMEQTGYEAVQFEQHITHAG